MKKITLKEYKEQLSGNFYRLGYIKSLIPVEDILFTKNWKKSDIENNHVFTAEFRSKDMIIKNQSEKEDSIFETFNTGDSYYSYQYNDLTYLFHVYSDIENVSIKAVPEVIEQ